MRDPGSLCGEGWQAGRGRARAGGHRALLRLEALRQESDRLARHRREHLVDRRGERVLELVLLQVLADLRQELGGARDLDRRARRLTSVLAQVAGLTSAARAGVRVMRSLRLRRRPRVQRGVGAPCGRRGWLRAGR